MKSSSAREMPWTVFFHSLRMHHFSCDSVAQMCVFIKRYFNKNDDNIFQVAIFCPSLSVSLVRRKYVKGTNNRHGYIVMVWLIHRCLSPYLLRRSEHSCFLLDQIVGAKQIQASALRSHRIAFALFFVEASSPTRHSIAFFLTHTSIYHSVCCRVWSSWVKFTQCSEIRF